MISEPHIEITSVYKYQQLGTRGIINTKSLIGTKYPSFCCGSKYLPKTFLDARASGNIYLRG